MDIYEAVFGRPWPWWAAGPAIGMVVTLLAWVTGKALGVSTGYGSACAIASHLSFFRAKEYGERWRLWFVLGLPLGGLLAALLAGTLAPSPAFGRLEAFTGGSIVAQAALLFGGGLLIGGGARWAGGCPSGHSIVGISQGAASSVVATIGFMLGGFATYNLLRILMAG